MEAIAEHQGKTIRFLEDGYMVNREEWTNEVTDFIAQKEGIK